MEHLEHPTAEVERRAYERASVNVFGRCLFQNDLEIPCQAINMSPGDIAIVATHSPQVEEHVIVYLDHIGRLEGPTTRVFDGGFAMLIEGTSRKREKLASRLEWLKNHHEFGAENLRRHTRLEPKHENSELMIADGRTYPIKIIDISISGAAVSIGVRPGIGAVVSLSGVKGTVVRHFDEGIAIEFDIPAEDSAFAKHFQ